MSPAGFRCSSAGELSPAEEGRVITIADGPVKAWLVSAVQSPDGAWTNVEIRHPSGGVVARTIRSTTTVLIHRSTD